MRALPSRAKKDLTRSSRKAQRTRREKNPHNVFEDIGGTRRPQGLLRGLTRASLSIYLRLTEMDCRLMVCARLLKSGTPVNLDEWK
jgi:hypothetical protein